MAVSLPAEVVYGKVTGSARLAVADGLDPDTLPDGEPATGTVTFTPAVDRIVLGTSNTILIIAPQTAMFDENGDFEIDLVATDIPDANPLNWTYNVQVVIDGMQRPWTFPCKIEGGTTVDISDIAPTKSSGGVFFTKGDPGKSAYQVAVDEGFTGTEAEWLASLSVYPEASHETIALGATATLPSTKTVLSVGAASASTVDVASAPDGTVVTVHVVSGWENITWAPEIIVNGQTTSTETWVVLVRTNGTWYALVSGESAVEETGWRDITLSLVGNWSTDDPTTRFYVNRIGDEVHIVASLYLGTAGSLNQTLDVLTLPTGYVPFIPDQYGRINLPGVGNDKWINGGINDLGEITIGAYGQTVSAGLYYITTSFMTKDPFPNPFPGTDPQ